MANGLAEIGVVIPAYQAQTTIGQVLKGLFELGFEPGQVIVVDDGSSDLTLLEAMRLGVMVERHKKNLGKGAAQRTGFRWAKVRGFSRVLMIDADSQHLTSEIPRLIAGAQDGASVVGSRRKDLSHMPRLNRWSNQTVSLVASVLAGERLPDVQCGFRLIAREVLDQVRLTSNHYEAETELLIKACRAGYRFNWVEVSAVYKGSRSHIHPLLDTLRFIKMAIRALWR